MKLLKTALLSAALASSAFAGTSYDKNPQAPQIQPTVSGCDCFAPGAAFGLYGGGFIPASDHKGELGGGALFEYFFNEYVGFQATYGLYATNSEHHQFDGSLVLRYPIKSMCIAPYMIAGGGGSTNASSNGDWHVGGGLEARFSSANCLGVFADGAYHFGSGNKQDYTIVRLGVKFPF